MEASIGFILIGGATRGPSAGGLAELMDRFNGDVDWSWPRISAWQTCGTGNCISFCTRSITLNMGLLATLGALQVWCNAKKDRGRALQDYHRGLALGGSRPLPELFAAAVIAQVSISKPGPSGLWCHWFRANSDHLGD